jgi:hypothetical protein
MLLRAFMFLLVHMAIIGAVLSLNAGGFEPTALLLAAR